MPGNENHILSSSLKGFVMFITYGPGNVLRSMYCIVMVSLHLLLSSDLHIHSRQLVVCFFFFRIYSVGMRWRFRATDCEDNH